MKRPASAAPGDAAVGCLYFFLVFLALAALFILLLCFAMGSDFHR